MRGKWIFVAFAASLGITAAYYEFSMFVVFISLLFLSWICLRESHPIIFTISAITMVVFATTFIWVDTQNQTKLTGYERQFSGEIQTIPQIDGDRLTLTYKLPSNEKLMLQYKINTLDEKESLQALQVGMYCQFTGKLSIPNSSRNDYAFDYKEYLYKKRIHWILTPDSIPLDKCQSSSSLSYILPKWRSEQLVFIKEHFPEPTSGIVQALIFGDRNGISENVINNFQKFGLIHLLAISGLHVGLVVAVVFYLLIRIGISRERAFSLLLFLLPFYMIIAGASPSVVRACFMTMLVMVAIRFQAKLSPLDALAIAFLAMLLANPYYLTDIGFQLSFLVSLSLILSSTTIISTTTSSWMQILLVSTIAQISSFPVILFYNYEISLLSLPLNFIFVPLISIIILPVAFLSFIFSHLSTTLSGFLVSVLSTIIQHAFLFLEQMEKIPFFQLTFGKPQAWLVIMYYVGIIYFFISWERQKTIILGNKALLPLILVLVFHWFSPYFSQEGRITMIDVGQGDSILIELPFRKAVYLIDTGGMVPFSQEEWRIRNSPFDVGKDILAPYLKAKGIRRINKVVLTHGDWDHIGGTEGIVKGFKIDEVIIGTSPWANQIEENERSLYEVIRGKEIPLKTVKDGDFWKEGNHQFYVIGPTGLEQSKNNQSIVLFSKIGGLRWLFTGDLEEEGEYRILSQYPNLKVDALKIAHHGSKTSTSSTYLNQLTPKYALISAGQRNRYGHPHPDILELLTERNIKVFRTDYHGSISYKFIGNNGTFELKIP